MTAPFFGFNTRDLLIGDETHVCANPGYRGVDKREEVIEAHPQDNWHVAMMPSHRKALNKETPIGVIMEALEKTKAQTCARVVQTFLGSSQFRFSVVQDMAHAPSHWPRSALRLLFLTSLIPGCMPSIKCIPVPHSRFASSAVMPTI